MYPAIIIMALALATAFTQVPTAGLQAFYPFNGNANDSTGRTLNNGKLFITNSPVFTTDRTGNGLACNFDGLNDYILVPNKSSFNMPRDSATVFAWYNSRTCGKILTGPRAIWDTYELSNTGKKRELSLYITAKNDSLGNPFQLLQAIAITSNNTDTELLVLPCTLYSEGWHSTGVIWEKPALKFYVDGTLAGSITATIPDAKMSTNNKTTLFGADVFTAKKCFCGLIDDIRLYNRGLMESEIALLTKEGSGNHIAASQGMVTKSRFNVVVENPRIWNSRAVKIPCPDAVWPPSSIQLFTVNGRLIANLFWNMKDPNTALCALEKTVTGRPCKPTGLCIIKISSSIGNSATSPVILLR
jgi:hypothetical protein